MSNHFKIILLGLTTILGSLLSSCDDEVGYNIPYRYVNIMLDLSDPENFAFKSGNAIAFDSIYKNSNVGYAGLIIIKGINPSNGYDAYYAFDQCCPIDPDNKHKLTPDGFVVICKKHDVTFSVIDGSGYPIDGHSKYPLLPYNARFSGSRLTISNK